MPEQKISVIENSKRIKQLENMPPKIQQNIEDIANLKQTASLVQGNVQNITIIQGWKDLIDQNTRNIRMIQQKIPKIDQHEVDLRQLKTQVLQIPKNTQKINTVEQKFPDLERRIRQNESGISTINDTLPPQIQANKEKLQQHETMFVKWSDTTKDVSRASLQSLKGKVPYITPQGATNLGNKVTLYGDGSSSVNATVESEGLALDKKIILPHGMLLNGHDVSIVEEDKLLPVQEKKFMTFQHVWSGQYGDDSGAAPFCTLPMGWKVAYVLLRDWSDDQIPHIERRPISFANTGKFPLWINWGMGRETEMKLKILSDGKMYMISRGISKDALVFDVSCITSSSEEGLVDQSTNYVPRPGCSGSHYILPPGSPKQKTISIDNIKKYSYFICTLTGTVWSGTYDQVVTIPAEVGKYVVGASTQDERNDWACIQVTNDSLIVESVKYIEEKFKTVIGVYLDTNLGNKPVLQGASIEKTVLFYTGSIATRSLNGELKQNISNFDWIEVWVGTSHSSNLTDSSKTRFPYMASPDMLKEFGITVLNVGGENADRSYCTHIIFTGTTFKVPVPYYNCGVIKIIGHKFKIPTTV